MEIFPRASEGLAQKEFGRDANIIKTKSFDLSVARDLVGYDIAGTCLWAWDASDRLASINIRLNDQLRDPITFSLGMFIRGTPFSRVYVSNTAQAGKTITFLYVREEDISQIQVVNPSVQFSAVDLTKATVLDTVADVTLGAAATTQILAANANRRAAFVHNLVSNTQTFRIGDSNAAAARGIPLAPGETIVISATEAIYGYNPGAAGETVAVMWTAD